GGPPPPPPPPPIPGIIPSSRLPSEIPARVPVMNPPAALAGAMLKDKKPFTYTPGGLDLSEINAFPRLIQKKMSDSITPRTTPSNQPRPQQNGNVATMDQPANGADLGPPIQSRSFRLLQNVLDHQDTAGSDDEISNYMQQCVPQSHAPVHQGVQPRQHYNQIQNQQPIYQRPEIQGQPQQYQQTASNNKQLAQSKQKEVPTSSRFFRMLQTITDTLPEGAEPQGPVHIPNFRQQQKPPQMQQQGQYQQLGQYQQPGQYQQSNQNQQPGGVRSATAADQAVPEPKKYMGGSIPSRSFKMLQAMTNTDDVVGPGQSDL
ncbi:hypothetical protein OTU49_014841, partial [Cherax quadricarinatus]